METATFVQPQSVSPAFEKKQIHSEIWAPLCFALIPMLALALAALFLGHGTISAASINNAIVHIGNAVDCLQNVACP